MEPIINQQGDREWPLYLTAFEMGILYARLSELVKADESLLGNILSTIMNVRPPNRGNDELRIIMEKLGKMYTYLKSNDI